MDAVADIPGLLPLWQEVSGGDPGIRIAVIDGPVDLSHPALSTARVTLGGQAVGLASVPTIRSEHGTHVTSLVMGAPGTSVLGIAPNCTATVFSIYREGIHGELEPSSQAELALAINQALADGADVINISSGQKTSTGQADLILADAVRRCADAGRLIVAAAGNDGCRCVQVPGALDSVLAVGACNVAGQPLPFSNFGDPYLRNGILAPGENVKGASPTEHVALRSGTSFATPIVTGVVALLLSYLRQTGRDADPRAVRAALLASAVPCDTRTAAGEFRCLAGRLDISGAIAALRGNGRDATDGISPSHATGDVSNPRDRSDVAEIPHPATQPRATRTREGMMGDFPPTAAVSTPLMLGPDGTPLSSISGVTAGDAPPAPPPGGTLANAATSAISRVATAHVAAAAPPPAGCAPLAAPPMGAGVVWLPMSVVGGLPQGWASVQVPAPSATLAPAVIPSAAVPRHEAPAAIRTSAANSGGGVRPAQAQSTGQMCFPIGQLYYDFGREARLDYFVQAIANWRDTLAGRGDPAWGPDRDRSGDTAAPYNPEFMARYLMNLAPGEPSTPGQGNNFPDADAITWTLTIDSVPVYAVKPLDVFGLGFYVALIQALWHQHVSRLDPGATSTPARGLDDTAPASRSHAPKGGVTRISMAGWVDSTNTTRLLNGMVVPILVSEWRGFYTWDLYTLLGPDSATWPPGAQGFLERIYNEFRNVGISPQDRALNYCAMNAYNTKRIFADVAKSGMRLDTVEVARSVICRPESDCWDVTFRFFDPTQVLTQARQAYQYTIDVSDVVPVAVGPLRQWDVY